MVVPHAKQEKRRWQNRAKAKTVEAGIDEGFSSPRLRTVYDRSSESMELGALGKVPKHASDGSSG
jgi:hypothetical protein